jgi:hypothetical protein
MNADVAEVVRLELLLLEPEVRNDADRVLLLLHVDFYEFGSSGRVWDRQSITEATGGSIEPIVATDITARTLGEDAVLVTYTSDVQGRRALRSSTWVRAQGSWRLLFHQGTLTA